MHRTIQCFRVGCPGIMLLVAICVVVTDEQSSSKISSILSTLHIYEDWTSSPNDKTNFLSRIREEVADLAPYKIGAMNFSADPCDNFYEFVCGKWIHDTPIPEEKASISMVWDTAEDAVTKEMNGLMASESLDGEEDLQRLRAYYKACMNVSLIETLGVAPLRFLLNIADSIQSVQDVQEAIATLESWNFNTLISLSVEPDLVNHTRHSLLIRSSGLSLPDYSWYKALPSAASKSPNKSEPDAEWKIHVIQTLAQDIKAMNILAGYTEAEAEEAVKGTFAIEWQLACILAKEPYGISVPISLQSLLTCSLIPLQNR
eukprot:766883-Hanusia_phi.AAC.2